MILFVTTSHSFLAIDSTTGLSQVIDRGRGLYYGIGYSEEEIFVGARKSPILADKNQRAFEKGSILVFDYQLNFKEELESSFPLRDIHQIVYHQDRLWVACSYDDMIAIYDYPSKTWDRWYPAGGVNGESDQYHINSLFIEDNQLYLLAHNYGESEIWVADPERLTIEECLKIGNKSHNIWKSNGDIFTCNSGKGRIESLSGFQFNVGKFPRGIAITENNIFLGQSEIAEREKRGLTTGSIRVMDRDWNTVHELHLPREGLVLEIRIPGQADLCYPGSAVGKQITLTQPEFQLPITILTDEDGRNSFSDDQWIEYADRFLVSGNTIAADALLNQALQYKIDNAKLIPLKIQILDRFFTYSEHSIKENTAKLIRSLARYSGRPYNKARLLDIGCGGNDFLAAIQTRVPRAMGCDLSTVGIRQAKESMAKIPLAFADNHTLPYADDSFDFVTCINTRLYFWDIQQSLTEITRITQPGGVVMLRIDMINYRLKGRTKPYRETIELEQWQELFETNGLTILQKTVEDHQNNSDDSSEEFITFILKVR